MRDQSPAAGTSGDNGEKSKSKSVRGIRRLSRKMSLPLLSRTDASGARTKSSEHQKHGCSELKELNPKLATAEPDSISIFKDPQHSSFMQCVQAILQDGM
jgi:hypothetical protein